MFKIGPKTRKGARFLPGASVEASADDPIYKRGFAIGGLHLTPSSKATAPSESPSSNNPEPSTSLPPFEAEAHRSLEESIHLYEQHTGQPWMEDDPESPGQEDDK